MELALLPRVPRAGLGRLARVALIASAVLCLGGPSSSALAASGGPTMTVTLRAFPTGTAIPNTLAGTVHLQPGAQVALAAPQQVFGSGTPQPSYAFGFWNITTDVRTTPTITFNAPTDTSTILATAWYFPTGGGGGGGTGVSTYAFSLNTDKVIAATPISSVTPSSAWTGAPSTSVSTTTTPSPVVIAALPVIAGSGRFKSWLQFGNGTVTNTTLTVPYAGASTAIAFFGIPVPDPCDDIRTELQYLSPGDFLNPAAYRAAFQALTHELRACEIQYGES